MNKSYFATNRLNKKLTSHKKMIINLIKSRSTIFMNCCKLKNNKMRMDSETNVHTEVTNQVASEITINRDLSKMGKGISETIVAIEVTEAVTEQAMTNKLITKESMLKVNSSGEEMTEVEVT